MARAVRQIKNADLVANVQRQSNEHERAGLVFKQDPAAGTHLGKGSTVTIWVSTGKPRVPVPDVRNQQWKDAQKALTALGLKPQEHIVPGKTKGLVTATDPPPNTNVVQGSTVRVNVESGPVVSAVPSVTGESLTQAADDLHAAGFNDDVAGTVPSDQPANTVVKQDPTANSQASQGSIVHLTLSAGPPQVTVPPVVNETSEQATADLEHAGFKVTTQPRERERPESGRHRPVREPGRRHVRGEGIDGDDHGRAVLGAGDHDELLRVSSARRRVRLAVLAGGRSSEHEISLASARSVVAALDPARYEVLEIGIGRDGRWELEAGERRELPEAGRRGGLGRRDPCPFRPGEARSRRSTPWMSSCRSSTARSARTEPSRGCSSSPASRTSGPASLPRPWRWTRTCSRRSCATAASRSPRHHAIRLGDAVENPLGYPVFVKPARLGSSVGITKVHSEEELAPAVELAFRHDEKVLVEEFVEGTEVEVGVLGNRVPPPIASLPGQIDTLEHEWYDYSSKYDEGGMELLVPPPDLPQETIELLQRRAVDSFVACECEGLARVDFFVRASDGEVVLNELNTMPGFTATSVWARLFDASGIGYAEALDRLIELALERHERRSKLEYLVWPGTCPVPGSRAPSDARTQGAPIVALSA